MVGVWTLRNSWVEGILMLNLDWKFPQDCCCCSLAGRWLPDELFDTSLGFIRPETEASFGWLFGMHNRLQNPLSMRPKSVAILFIGQCIDTIDSIRLMFWFIGRYSIWLWCEWIMAIDAMNANALEFECYKCLLSDMIFMIVEWSFGYHIQKLWLNPGTDPPTFGYYCIFVCGIATY